MEHHYSDLEQIPSEGFFVTVFSSLAQEFVSGNTSSSFSNKLSIPFLADSETLEVGLTELYFKDGYTRESKDKDKNAKTVNSETKKPVQKFFLNAQESFKADFLSKAEFRVQKKSTNTPTGFVIQVGKDLGMLTDKIKLEVETPGSSYEYFTTLRFLPMHDNVLEMDKLFAEASGFDKTTFLHGSYTSKYPISEKKIAKIPDKTFFKFTVMHWEPGTLTLKEPESYDIDSLCDAISEAFEANKHFKVRLFPNKAGTVLHVFIDKPNLRFTLPKSVNEYLGLNDNFEFSLPYQEIYLPKSIHFPEEATDSNEPSRQVFEKSHQMHVVCNIVKPQYFGSSLLPVLRTIPRNILSATNNETHLVFQPVYFMPLRNELVSYIEIKLLDEDLQLLDPSTYPTTAVLQVRPKHL